MDFGKLIAPYARRIANMLARGSLVLADSSKKMQTLQVHLLAGEVKDGFEHFEAYGLTSNPHPGAEPIAAFLGGDRGHGVVLIVADRRYRLTGLAEGEVALYDDQGQKVHLTRNGIVIYGANKPLTVDNVADINVTGSGVANITVTGKATITASEVDLVGTGGTAKGVVQADCLCAFTGAPHVMISAKVKGSM